MGRKTDWIRIEKKLLQGRSNRNKSYILIPSSLQSCSLNPANKILSSTSFMYFCHSFVIFCCSKWVLVSANAGNRKCWGARTNALLTFPNNLLATYLFFSFLLQENAKFSLFQLFAIVLATIRLAEQRAFWALTIVQIMVKCAIIKGLSSILFRAWWN